MSGAPDLAARMQAFRARFIERAAGQRAELAAAIAARDPVATRALCHSLAGNAGLFGFAAVGELARSVEQAIDAEDTARQQVLTSELLTALDQLDQPDG